MDSVKASVDRLLLDLMTQRRDKCYRRLCKVNADADAADVAKHVDLCLDGTRTDLLKYLVRWACFDDNAAPVCWLYGLAGTGKSTLARTLCKRIRAEDVTIASFFISQV